MPEMKLYCAEYLDDTDEGYCLLVAESEKAADQKFNREVYSKLSCPMFYHIYEVDSVDGYKVKIKRKDE